MSSFRSAHKGVWPLLSGNAQIRRATSGLAAPIIRRMSRGASEQALSRRAEWLGDNAPGL